MTDFPSLNDLIIKQSSKLLPLHFQTKKSLKFTLCTSPLLFRWQPPQSNYPSFIYLDKKNHRYLAIQYVVLQEYLNITFNIRTYPIHWIHQIQWMTIVKVHRVFPSYCKLLCIFTEIWISLGPCWRQWRNRYAIHAGHQLNDKEFRYLWILRIGPSFTGSYKISNTPLLFNYQHRTGVRPNTS